MWLSPGATVATTNSVASARYGSTTIAGNARRLSTAGFTYVMTVATAPRTAASGTHRSRMLRRIGSETAGSLRDNTARLRVNTGATSQSNVAIRAGRVTGCHRE